MISLTCHQVGDRGRIIQFSHTASVQIPSDCRTRFQIQIRIRIIVRSAQHIHLIRTGRRDESIVHRRRSIADCDRAGTHRRAIVLAIRRRDVDKPLFALDHGNRHLVIESGDEGAVARPSNRGSTLGITIGIAVGIGQREAGGCCRVVWTQLQIRSTWLIVRLRLFSHLQTAHTPAIAAVLPIAIHIVDGHIEGRCTLTSRRCGPSHRPRAAGIVAMGHTQNVDLHAGTGIGPRTLVHRERETTLTATRTSCTGDAHGIGLSRHIGAGQAGEDGRDLA